MEIRSCPGPAVWQKYVLGQVAEAEQDALEAHLADCPTCLEQLGKLPGEDTLVSDLRTQLGLPAQPPDAAVDEVIGRAVKLSECGARPAVGTRGADPVSLDFLAPAQSADEIGRLAQFRVLRLLGRGGMGVVFLAEDTALQRRVALKVLSPDLARRPDSAARFLREARAAAALHHNHVVTIYQVGEADGPTGTVPFLAMEFLEGESLETALKQHPPSLREAVRIAREVAEGLAAAHQSGLIHRDIKPDNIWLEAPQGRVKLLDFGLARTVRVDSPLTPHGLIVGTPAYLAPEQAAGAVIDGRADLFSLGCVLYQLGTGQLPFPTTDVMATLTAIATSEPTAVRALNPAVPPALAELIHQLLAKNPSNRPTSAQEVVARLAAIERQLAEEPLRRPQPATRRRVAVLALAALVACVLVAVVVFRTPGGKTEFVIDTDDPDIVFRADGKGGVVLEDRKTDRRYQLKVGRYDPATGEFEIDVTDPVGGLQFSSRTLTIKRGEKVALSASIRPQAPEPLAIPAGVSGIDKDWLARVATLPADEQVAVVTARLKALNAGFDGPVTPTIEKGVVVGLAFSTEEISNIAPVRGLPGLRELKCEALTLKPGRLVDLTPLRGLPLRVLSVAGNHHLSDLQPLAGMPLVNLNCNATAVADLTPLQKCPLEALSLGGARVVGLAPLKNMPLKELTLNDLLITDLEPLTGMRLKILLCGNCPLVKDLTPLKGMPLEYLHAGGTAVTDLTPLKGAPLSKLNAPGLALVNHREFLNAIPTLETIDFKPVKQFWADWDAMQKDKKP